MRVVIVHHHLNPGGVTRIIESQVSGLKNLPVQLLTGSLPEQLPKPLAYKDIISFPDLNYLPQKRYSRQEIQKILNRILHFLEKNTGKNTLLHVHNLNLGKNPVLTYAVFLLAQKGIPVFNHAHDFAEDRPANYQFLQEIIEGNLGQKLTDILYPGLPNLHFGVLNSLDYKRLLNQGVDEDRLIWLPNPVTFPSLQHLFSKSREKEEICRLLGIAVPEKLVTYPVRVIRRKNIGEFILLSLLFQQETRFVVTQPPQNPVEQKLYRQWLAFCQNESLNVIFEAGEKVDFHQLLSASDFCITTSYREGFGMVFLEPWLANTPVTGRNIEYITSDFRNDGLEFPRLYNQIIIPGYSRDFKDLSMKDQMEIIRNIRTGTLKKEAILQKNPDVKTMFREVPVPVMESNRTIIKNKYALEKYGTKLQNRYQKMVE